VFGISIDGLCWLVNRVAPQNLLIISLPHFIQTIMPSLVVQCCLKVLELSTTVEQSIATKVQWCFQLALATRLWYWMMVVVTTTTKRELSTTMEQSIATEVR
jgi:hypothetical protein